MSRIPVLHASPDARGHFLGSWHPSPTSIRPAMNLHRHSSRLGSRIFIIALVLPALAQIATVDVSSPTDPYVSFDEDPYQYSPPISENPTVVYPGGAGTGSTAYTTDPITSQQ